MRSLDRHITPSGLQQQSARWGFNNWNVSLHASQHRPVPPAYPLSWTADLVPLPFSGPSCDFILFLQGLPITVNPSLMTSLTLNYNVSEDPFCKCNHIQKDKDLDPSTYESGGHALVCKVPRKYVLYNYIFIISYPEVLEVAELHTLFTGGELRV